MLRSNDNNKHFENHPFLSIHYGKGKSLMSMRRITYIRFLIMILLVSLVFSMSGCGRRPQDVGVPLGSEETRYPASYPHPQYGPSSDPSSDPSSLSKKTITNQRDDVVVE